MFTFDRVYDHKSSQEDCLQEVRPLAVSAMDGYNCCVLAYGQTGSGKACLSLGRGAGARGWASRMRLLFFFLFMIAPTGRVPDGYTSPVWQDMQRRVSNLTQIIRAPSLSPPA